jgi:hypothetical protein
MHGTDYSMVTRDTAASGQVPDIAFMRSAGLEQDGKWVGAFTSRYKLILSVKDDPWLLDLKEDPDELVNFIHEPGNEGVVKDLASKLQGYASQFQDPFLQNTKMSADLSGLLK